MKLVVVNYSFDAALGGPDALLDRYYPLTGWCAAVAAAGLSVQVVQAFTRDATLQRNGVEYLFRAAGGRRSLAVSGVHDAVAGCEPDIVHVNGLDAPVQTWLLRRSLMPHVPIVVQDHAGAPSRRFSIKGAIRRVAMRAVDAYLFTSREQAKPWVDGGFMRAAAVHEVLAASTDLGPVDRSVARERTGMAGSPALLWVARLDANKDPLTVLEAFRQLLEFEPDATLTMVYGTAELLPDVRRRVADSDALRARVRLVGTVPHAEMAAWFSAADLFVAGSAREVCGYALLEACACGALPVATSIEPFLAITGNGTIGVHWPRGNAGALADVLRVASRRDRERDRRDVLDYFARNLSWEVVGSRARTIYETLVEQRRQRLGG